MSKPHYSGKKIFTQLSSYLGFGEKRMKDEKTLILLTTDCCELQTVDVGDKVRENLKPNG